MGFMLFIKGLGIVVLALIVIFILLVIEDKVIDKFDEYLYKRDNKE